MELYQQILRGAFAFPPYVTREEEETLVDVLREFPDGMAEDELSARRLQADEFECDRADAEAAAALGAPRKSTQYA